MSAGNADTLSERLARLAERARGVLAPEKESLVDVEYYLHLRCAEITRLMVFPCSRSSINRFSERENCVRSCRYDRTDCALMTRAADWAEGKTLEQFKSEFTSTYR